MARQYKLNYNKTTLHPIQEAGETLQPPYSYDTTPEQWPDNLVTFFSEGDVVIDADAGTARHKDYQQ